jgi:E3 ubiquitin-protein ligase BAH
LGAKDSFSTALPDTLISNDFSKALAAQVATDIVSVVPQLNDYLCPICFNIAYRPVRLRCGHLFCIRCIVMLQRQQRDMCALCRKPVVMDADSSKSPSSRYNTNRADNHIANIDPGMTEFLKRYFPEEVKEKKKDVGKAIAEEVYGDHKCCIM